MTLLHRRALVAAFAAAPLITPNARAQPGPLPPDQAFQRLLTLVGNWQGVSESGAQVLINFRTTAAGSALVETWTMSPTRESLTIYHMDGDDLLATHYCPIGNQPRLRYQREQSNERLLFRLQDGTNIDTTTHLDEFWLRFHADGTVLRAESYVYAARPERTGYTLTRLPAPSASP